jgi:hypothetical protein
MNMSVDRVQSPWPFRLWISAVVLLVLATTALVSAWLVKHAFMKGSRLTEAQAEVVLSVADFPSHAKASLRYLVNALHGDPHELLLDRNGAEHSHWQRRFPAQADTGYLLFSGVDHEAQRAIVSLIRVADGSVLARWIPDWADVIRRTTPTKYSKGITERTIMAVHPVLLPSGVQYQRCNGAHGCLQPQAGVGPG